MVEMYAKFGIAEMRPLSISFMAVSWALGTVFIVDQAKKNANNFRFISIQIIADVVENTRQSIQTRSCCAKRSDRTFDIVRVVWVTHP